MVWSAVAGDDELVGRVIDAIEYRVSQMEDKGFRSPLDENAVHFPQDGDEDLSFLESNWPNYRELLKFYQLCDGISLPSVGNGIFIHRRSVIRTNVDRGVPVSLQARGPVFVFGSDGIGGLLAQSITASAEIIRLSRNPIERGVFDDVRHPCEIVESSFADFLLRVLNDVDACVGLRPHWRFIA